MCHQNVKNSSHLIVYCEHLNLRLCFISILELEPQPMGALQKIDKFNKQIVCSSFLNILHRVVFFFFFKL